MGNEASVTIVYAAVEVVEQQVVLTLDELCRGGGVSAALVQDLVAYGLLDPAGERNPETWRFAGASLAITRRAQRLIDDLGINASGAAVVIELLARIERLERRRFE